MSWELAVAAGLAVGAVLSWPARGPDRAWNELGAARSGVARAPMGPLTIDDVTSSMCLLSLALRSGCGVLEAIEQVARDGPEPAAEDLRTVAAALRWGVDEGHAWAAVDPVWRHAAQSMRLAARAGIAPSALLLTSAEDLRASELARLDVEAARVGVRMVLPLGLAFLPAFCLTSVIPIVLALAGQVLGP